MMPDEIELLQKWMSLPETNRAVMEALTADYMSEPAYAGTMKVQKTVWSEEDERC